MLKRGAVAVAALLIVLVAAERGDAATSLVVGVLVVVAFAAWWRRHRSAAGCVLSLAVTLTSTSATTAWAAEHSPLVSAIQSGLVFWLFAGVVVGMVWLVPSRVSRSESRVITTVVSHAVLVVASPFVVVAPVWAPIAGLCAATGVVAWRTRRGGRRKLPIGARTDLESPDMPTRAPVDRAAVALEAVDRAAVARGVGRTAEALSTGLPQGWHVVQRWALPDDGGLVEVLVVGPAGVFVIETRDWPGSVTVIDVAASTQAYALDGDPHELVARLTPGAQKVRRAATYLAADGGWVDGLVVFWSTSLPADVVELTLLGASGECSRTDADAKTTDVRLRLVRGELLAEWLSARPVRLTQKEVGRIAARVRGGAVSVR